MDGKRGGKGAVRKIDLDAFFQLAKDIAPFLLLLLPGFGLVGPQHFSEIPFAQQRAPFHALLQPAFHHGFFLVGREDIHGIPAHAHASGRAKNGPPFHLAR